MVRDTQSRRSGVLSGPQRRAAAPVGIIDIGSNSIRLVVFEALKRHPVPLFNEKVLCAIGKHTATSGMLDPEGLTRARNALARFRAIADNLGVERLVPVATAAVRESRNGQDFVREASEILGVEVSLLSGDQEAGYAALGVLSGIPDAAGLVGDLGGGSLELTEVEAGERGRTATLSIGPLRLIDQSAGRMAEARRLVDAALASVPWLGTRSVWPLYAVGGVWRSLARLHMRQRRSPLHILQHYEIPADDAVEIARLIAGQSRKSLQVMGELPRRRLDTIPFGALVLERLVATARIDRVIVSAYGLREGLLYSLLDPAERALDPLLEAARELARKVGRHPDVGEELVAWTGALFEGESEGDARLRTAAALLSDIAWRDHPDYRAEHAFRTVLRAPFAGINHRARAFLALCVYHRYGGDEEGRAEAEDLHPLMGNAQVERAMAIGAALRLGHALSASSPGLLSRCALQRDGVSLVMKIPTDLTALIGEIVRKRLSALAEAMGLSAHIEAGGRQLDVDD